MCSNVELDELQAQMKMLQAKQSFITTWDPESLLPPHTNVVLEADDERLVHAHKSTLVRTPHLQYALQSSLDTP